MNIPRGSNCMGKGGGRGERERERERDIQEARKTIGLAIAEQSGKSAKRPVRDVTCHARFVNDIAPRRS